MAVKTFGSERLVSTDINTYLANSGLVFVKSQAVAGGAGVPSVTVTNAFSADYDAYKIIATNVVSSAAGVVTFQLSGLTAGYYGNLIYANYVNGSVLSFGNNNNTVVSHAGGTDGQFMVFDMEVVNPFLARPTSMQSRFQDSSNAGTMTAVQNSATSATGFTIGISSGTVIGGVITVYGYRKA